MAGRIGGVFQLGREMAEDKKNTRGGARPGAGRKPLTEKERKAARKELDSCRKMIRLDPDDISKLEACARSDGITPHAWLVRAIRAALHKPSPQD